MDKQPTFLSERYPDFPVTTENKAMRNGIVSLMVAVAVVLGGAVANSAHGDGSVLPGDMPACDRVTGGGFITGQSGHKADFGLAAGCQKDHWDDDDGDDGHRHGSDERRTPRFGHLEFQDKRLDFKLRSSAVTAYFPVESSLDPTAIALTSSSSNEPRGTRMLCGTGRTNKWGDVDWAVQVADNGEPGRAKDDFIIQVKKKDGTPVYEAAGKLQGGNIQLHKPPRHSSPDGFGGDCSQFL